MKAVALLCLIGCGGVDPLRYGDRMSIWAEELPSGRIGDRVTFCAMNRLNLNVSVVQGVTDRGYLEALCGAAARAGVSLRLWPGLSRAAGYWPGQGNVDEFLAWVDELQAHARAVCPRLDGFVVDMEMPIARVAIMADLRKQGKSDLEIAMWLLAGRDAAAFERARGLYDEAGKRARAVGWRWAVTTLPTNADDWSDGDETIAQALWTPVEGITWDEVSFQVYRSLFDQQFAPPGERFSAGLIGSYAEAIRERWGALGGMDLGTTGSGIGIPMGLGGAAELQADIGAALAAGIAPGRIAVYSLEGLDGKGDAAAWVAVPAARAAAPTKVDRDLRATFRLLDLLAR